ncbi:hypothetical protein, partial [uncultured Chryseobacterium sp.]|uniref:hypothetical protein n=1 Tax=uncultured Chryseobacterium sp. TaxID=259322 RepID=UPI00258842E4
LPYFIDHSGKLMDNVQVEYSSAFQHHSFYFLSPYNTPVFLASHWQKHREVQIAYPAQWEPFAILQREDLPAFPRLRPSNIDKNIIFFNTKNKIRKN